MLARWIGADMRDVTYLCAGINHQAHYLEFKVRGEDAYPLIRKALENPDIIMRSRCAMRCSWRLITMSQSHQVITRNMWPGSANVRI